MHGDQTLFRSKKLRFDPNLPAILDFGVRNLFQYQTNVRNGFLEVELSKKVYLFIFIAFICHKLFFYPLKPTASFLPVTFSCESRKKKYFKSLHDLNPL